MSKLERITVTMPAEMAARLRAAVERGEYARALVVDRRELRYVHEGMQRLGPLRHRRRTPRRHVGQSDGLGRDKLLGERAVGGGA